MKTFSWLSTLAIFCFSSIPNAGASEQLLSNIKLPPGFAITVFADYEVFAQGWPQKNLVLGRPVDLEIMADGSLLVSDDHGNRIYRITYRE